MPISVPVSTFPREDNRQTACKSCTHIWTKHELDMGSIFTEHSCCHALSAVLAGHCKNRLFWPGSCKPYSLRFTVFLSGVSHSRPAESGIRQTESRGEQNRAAILLNVLVVMSDFPIKAASCLNLKAVYLERVNFFSAREAEHVPVALL